MPIEFKLQEQENLIFTETNPINSKCLFIDKNLT